MNKQKSLIGMELDNSFRTIEQSQIDRLNRALQKQHAPLWSQAQKTSQTKPNHHLPSFLVGNFINFPKIYKALDLEIENVLLSRESIICHNPLKIGDAVTIRTFLRDAYEQQASSNPIGFIVLESIGYLDTDLAFYCERVMAIRGGFKRGRVK